MSAGEEPASVRSPPWRTRSGAGSRRSARTASKAVRLPWISETMAIRILVPICHRNGFKRSAALPIRKRMHALIGIAVVFGAVIGGFLLESGNLYVLLQP